MSSGRSSLKLPQVQVRYPPHLLPSGPFPIVAGCTPICVCLSMFLTGCEFLVGLAQGPVGSWCSWEICCLSECGVLPLGSIRASAHLLPMSFFQILFACAEALHAHGYSSEASRLTVELAQDLLANPPDLKVEPPPAKVREIPPFSLRSHPNPLPHPQARVSSLHQGESDSSACLLVLPSLGQEE